MARKDNRRRSMLGIRWPSWSNEVLGLVLICAGLLCFLSLISYTPHDLPVLGLFESFAPDAEPNQPRGNYIGPVGTLLGLLQVAGFGAAGYLIPLALLWFGVVKLVFDGRLWPRSLAGFGVLIVSGAGLLQALTEVRGGLFVDWARQCNITGPGGLIGLGVGHHLVMPLLGRWGAVLVLACAYLVALVLLTGQPPIRFAKETARLLARGAAGLWHWWRKDQPEPEPAPPAGRRRAARGGRPPAPAPPELDADGMQQLLPLRETPPPQIIDASQRRAHLPRAGERPFERRRPAHQGLSTSRFADYQLPGFSLLDADVPDESPQADRDQLLAAQRTIIETLAAFGIEVTPGDITRGPTVTRYEIYPTTGLRVSRIAQLEADLARATKAERINILAPIPGKDTVGIEIANTQKVMVPLHELLTDPEFRSAKKKIPLALGKDVYGKTVIGDLAAMPHLLVAGATGSGKSVCINSIIASILFKFSPDDLRFIMVDPKVVEMQIYNQLPHLVTPVVIDPRKVVAALKWVVNEMERRYQVFAKVGARNFDAFNSRPKAPATPVPEPEPEPEADSARIEEIARALEQGGLGPEPDGGPDTADDELEVPDRFPYIVVVIDELADLMQTAPADVELCIARIAQKARAAGIHLIIATQTPRADVVTGIIKANIPCRIAFQVSSQLDSRVILDTKGAEKLVGKGDMLYLPPGSAKLERAQGSFLSDAEVERIVNYCAQQAGPQFEKDIQQSIGGNGDDEEEDVSEADEETLDRCIEVVRQERKASTSLLQRRLRLGYTRAARMIDIMEQRGLIGPGDGAKPREIFLPPEEGGPAG